MTWIRVETNVAENDKVIALAEGCGISVEAALGFLIRFWGRVAEHRPDGDLSQMSDSALEQWAGWNGMPTVFTQTLRKLFVRNNILEGWVERQGKLAQRAAADRERKRRGNSAELPPLRNDTVRSTTTTTARARLREQLTTEGQEAFDGLIKASAQPEALVGECTMILAGERQIKPNPTPEGLSLALCDLRTNNQRPTARSVRTYTADAMRQLTEGISTSREASGSAWDKAMASAKEREKAHAD